MIRRIVCGVLVACAILPVAIPLLSSVEASAQTPGTVRLKDVRKRLGLFGGYGFDQGIAADSGSFLGIAPATPSLKTRDGNGFTIGLLWEYPIAAPALIGLRASWMQQNLSMLRDTIVQGMTAGEPAPVTMEDEVQAIYKTVGVELMLQYRPILNLWVMAGARAGYLFQPSFDRTQRAPAGSTFSDGRNILQQTGDLAQRNSLQGWFVGGLSYELLGIDGGMILAPEVFYYLPLTSLSPDVSFKSATLRLGLAIKFTPPVIVVPAPFAIEPRDEDDKTDVAKKDTKTDVDVARKDGASTEKDEPK